jgi:hypothetical protein
LQYFALLSAVAWGFGAEAATRDNIRTRAPETPSKILCQTFKIGCVKKSSAAAKKKKSARKSKPAVAASAKPAPAEKPAPPSETASTEPAPVAGTEPSRSVVPIPQPKPKVETRSAAVAATVPAPPPARPTAPAASSTEPRGPLAEHGLAEEADAACRDALTALGVTFTVPDRVEGKGQCHVPNPVQLTSLAAAEGRVELPGRPLLNCRFAERFSTWLADVASPVVTSGTGETLAAVSTGPGYECRGRNGDSSAKISEHAFGNAVDIDGLVLSGGTRVEIADVAETHHRFRRVLSALRVSGCGYFTTVLGPGANAAHASHFHFDLGRHGKSERTRICE